MPGPVVEGRACFPDQPCQTLTWTLDADAPPPDATLPQVAASGMEVWDHVARRWVDTSEVGADGPIAELAPWVGPLGDVWVRVTGALEPFDLAPQSVSATLQGGCGMSTLAPPPPPAARSPAAGRRRP